MGELFLPKVLSRVIGIMDTVDQITPDVFASFVKSLQNEEEFLMEFIDIVGKDTFRELVCKLGGNVVRIPKPQDVFNAVFDYIAENGE